MTSPRPRVLVADDDERARTAMCRGLRRTFTVEEACDGSEAVARIEAGDMFDALLLDLEMPGMDGRRTLEIVTVLAPQLAQRTLIVSGGALDESLYRWLCERPPGSVIEKPVGLANLVAAIERLLALR